MSEDQSRWLVEGSRWGSSSVYEVVRETDKTVAVKCAGWRDTRRINKHPFQAFADTQQAAETIAEAFKTAHSMHQSEVREIENALYAAKTRQTEAMLAVLNDTTKGTTP